MAEENEDGSAGLCLLSLDGGGVRGLSTLIILQSLMTKINNKRTQPAKPCEVFDLIGGTSTGGLIAIMLGRLEMEISECIDAYKDMFKDVFENPKHHLPVSFRGSVQARFDKNKLQDAIAKQLEKRGFPATDMFEDGKERGCRTFVVATRKENKNSVRIRDYRLSGEDNRDPATIIEAALATSAATTFFPPVKIGSRKYVDGALGANNPVDVVWREAQNIWCSESDDQAQLSKMLKCYISVGTGNPGTSPIKDGAVGFAKVTLKDMVTETERTATAAAETFRAWLNPRNGQRYFRTNEDLERFNVEQGLQDVGLQEYLRVGEIEAATHDYLDHPAQKLCIDDCALNMQIKRIQRNLNFQGTTQSNKSHDSPAVTDLTELRQKILDWLNVTDQRSLQDSHRQKRILGTGLSFVHGPFRSWISSGKSLLWLSGDVGRGKTMICSLLVDEIPTLCANLLPDRAAIDAVVFFYVLFDDNATHTLLQLLRTSLVQLCPRFTVFSELIDLYESNTPFKASQTDLMQALITIIRNRVCQHPEGILEPSTAFRSLTFVIDGLDEIPDVSQQIEILKFLRFLASQNFINVRIVVASRPDALINAYFESWEGLSLQTGAVEADISLYACTQIEEHPLLASLSPGLKKHIVRRLSHDSKGMFRLASLQMQELISFSGRSLPQKYVDRILDGLPDKLDAFYERILNKIPRSVRNDLYGVLKWLLCARRPLRVEEIVDACITIPHKRAVIDIAARLDPEDIINHLGGLIKKQTTSYIPTAETVSLAHFSVQEYLAPQREAWRPDSPWRIDTTLANLFIAQCCLAYVHHCSLQDDEDPEAYPLRSYAWLYWHTHLAIGDHDHDPNTSFERRSMRLLNSIAFPFLYQRHGGAIDQGQQDKDQELFNQGTQYLQSEDRMRLIATLQQKTVGQFSHQPSPQAFQFPSPSDVGRHGGEMLPFPRLPDYSRTVRLLVILPKLERVSTINIRLVADTLDNGPQFSAISYVWYGSDVLPSHCKNEEWINVDGRDIGVSRNVVNALAQLRSSRPITVWLYSLCLNVIDVGERRIQFNHVKDIYSSAEESLLWLGPATKKTEAGIKILIDPGVTQDKNLLSYKDVAALDDILTRPTWRRSWIIQEIAVPAQITVMCGPFSFNFGRMMLLHSMALRTKSNVLPLHWKPVLALQLIRNHYQSFRSLSLYQLLQLTRTHLASYATDKIFSLLPLVSEQEKKLDVLFENYTLEPSMVFARAVIHILKAGQDLDVLSQIDHHQDHDPSNYIDYPKWPSWVPTWDGGAEITSLQLVQPSYELDTSTLFQACDSRPEMRFTSDYRILIVDGLEVDDIVESIGISQAPGHQRTVVSTISEARPESIESSTTRERYRLHGGMWQALIRTVLTDRNLSLNEPLARLGPEHLDIATKWPQYLPDVHFFFTRSGYIGISVAKVDPGDLVVLFFGAKVPFILRRCKLDLKYWRLIGECYVHGIMDGELISEQDDRIRRTFEIK